MAFGDGLTEGEPCSSFFITGHDQPISDFLFCFFPKVLHGVHVLCCHNQVTQSVFGIGQMTQVAAEGELFLSPGSGQVRPLVRLKHTEHRRGRDQQVCSGSKKNFSK